MQRTEQSKHRAGHEQDRTSLTLVWSASAETLQLEDMAQAFGARIPASLDPFSANETPMRHDSVHGLHPFS